MAIKTAREVALMPYAQRTLSDRGLGRGSRSGAGRHGDSTTKSTGSYGDDEGLDLNDVDVDVHELEEVDA
jgi:hypothetical protein